MNGFLRPIGATREGAIKVASPLAVEVSLIMVVYMTGPALFESIDYVLGEPRVGEFVIVDNGSTPEDEARLRALALEEPRVKLLVGHGNVGFARGANMGASAATGRLLLFLNPDAFLQPGCVAALEATANANASGQPCLIGAKVLNVDGTEQRGGRRGEITPVTTLLSFTRLSERIGFLRPFEIHRESDPTPVEPVEVAAISGACFFMSRAHFAALGGFDGGFFLHVEDVDLCWRVRQRGGRVIFQPSARVVHLGSTSLTHPVKIEYWKGLGLWRYFRKRADTTERKILAYSLGPLIVAVAVCRPAIRALLGAQRPGRAGPHQAKQPAAKEIRRPAAAPKASVSPAAPLSSPRS